jgi:hypothetical protein
MDLFPETLGKPPAPIEYTSATMRNKWDQSRLIVRLIPSWDAQAGLWSVGWFCLIDKALDEHLPLKVTPPNYPWYRPATFPQGRSLDVAQGIAARAVKIVMEQMVEHVGEDILPELRRLQHQIERDAQRWFGAPLILFESPPCALFHTDTRVDAAQLPA